MITPRLEARVIALARRPPVDGSTHWSSRKLAKAAEVIGIHRNPPKHAAVFCLDEKTAIQALDRLDPVLPLSPVRAEQHRFAYYRHGALSPHAALDTLSGEAFGRAVAPHER